MGQRPPPLAHGCAKLAVREDSLQRLGEGGGIRRHGDAGACGRNVAGEGNPVRRDDRDARGKCLDHRYAEALAG